MLYPGLGGAHITCIVLCAIFLVWFYRRRKLYPLSGRYPRSSILNGCVVVLTLINQCFTVSMDVYTATYPCSLGLLTYEWLLPVSLTSVTMRAWLLLGQMEITSHVRAVTHAPAKFITDLPWFVRNRSWVKPQTVLRVSLVICLTTLAIWLILVGSLYSRALTYRCETSEEIKGNNGAVALGRVATALPFVYVILTLVPVAMIAHRLARHKERDAFGMGNELRMIGWSIIAMVVIEIPNILLGINELVYTTIIILSAEVLIFSAMIVVPIVRSYQFQAVQRQQAHLLEKVNKLTDLLALPQGYELFSTYCVSEFCSEGLNFWARVNAFRMSCRRPHLTNDQMNAIIDEAHSIMETFVDSGASLEVNISSALRMSVRNALISRTAALRSFMASGAILTSPHVTTVGDDGTPTPPVATPLRRGVTGDQHVLTGPSTSYHVPPTSASAASTPTGGIAITAAAGSSMGTGITLTITAGSTPNSANPSPQPANPLSPIGMTASQQRLAARTMSPSFVTTSPPSPNRTMVGNEPQPTTPIGLFSTIFDDAQAACILLLQMGAFQRFTTSPVFKAFVDGLHHGNSSKEAMEHAVSRLQMGAPPDGDSVYRGSLLSGGGAGADRGVGLVSRVGPHTMAYGGGGAVKSKMVASPAAAIAGGSPGHGHGHGHGITNAMSPQGLSTSTPSGSALTNRGFAAANANNGNGHGHGHQSNPSIGGGMHQPPTRLPGAVD